MALSTLYLATPPTDEDLQWVARRCAASRYPDEELDRIMFVELYPALIGNLARPGGERAGFDAEWLAAAVAGARRPRVALPWWLSPRKQRYLGGRWRAVRRRLRALRER